MPIAPDVYKKIVMANLWLFSRIYQRTPHQYLTRKRVEQARQWLAGEDFSVSEICNNVGFESVGSFSVLFKKEIGFAPQYYRNQAWLKKRQSLQQPRSFTPHCFIEQLRVEG